MIHFVRQGETPQASTGKEPDMNDQHLFFAKNTLELKDQLWWRFPASRRNNESELAAAREIFYNAEIVGARRRARRRVVISEADYERILAKY